MYEKVTYRDLAGATTAAPGCIPTEPLAASKSNRISESPRRFAPVLDWRGRTNANCWAVDLFFANSEGWEKDWAEQDLPEDFHDILAMMGEALHDTVLTLI